MAKPAFPIGSQVIVRDPASSYAGRTVTVRDKPYPGILSVGWHQPEDGAVHIFALRTEHAVAA